MDTSQYSESDNITAQIVRDSPTKKAIILSDARVEEVTFGTKTDQRLTFQVEIDGKKKNYRPNKATIKNLQASFGRESKAWLGKVLNFSVVQIAGKDSVLGVPEK